MAAAQAYLAGGRTESPSAAKTPEELLREIDEIQARSGLTSPELLEPLTALRLLYEERGDFELALAAIDEAMQVVEVNYGLHTLDEAILLAQSVRIERARGDAEAAWRNEQDVLRLIRRHPYDARTIPLVRGIGAARDPRETPGRRAAAGSHLRLLLPRVGVRRRVADARRLPLRQQRERHQKAASGGCSLRIAGGATDRSRRVPGRMPEPRTVESRPRPNARTAELEALDALFAVVDYALCTDAKYRLALAANAPPEELAHPAASRRAAVAELAAQAARHEQRFGSLPTRVDAVLDSLRRP